MKRFVQITLAVLCLVGLMMAGTFYHQQSIRQPLLPVAQAQTLNNPLLTPSTPTCSNGTLQGHYGVHFQSSAPGLGDAVAVAHATFDGAGNVRAKGTINLAGRVIEDTVPGTYRVNSDCTVTASIVYAQWGVTVTGTGVIVNGGREISFIATSPNDVQLSGTIKKL